MLDPSTGSRPAPVPGARHRARGDARVAPELRLPVHGRSRAATCRRSTCPACAGWRTARSRRPPRPRRPSPSASRPAGLRRGVFWGCYAMAETTFASPTGTPATATASIPAGPSGQAGVPLPVLSVGRPLDGVEVDVVDCAARRRPRAGSASSSCGRRSWPRRTTAAPSDGGIVPRRHLPHRRPRLPAGRRRLRHRPGERLDHRRRRERPPRRHRGARLGPRRRAARTRRRLRRVRRAGPDRPGVGARRAGRGGRPGRHRRPPDPVDRHPRSWPTSRSGSCRGAGW